MNWEPTVFSRICEAILILQWRDGKLFKPGCLVGERTVAHRLAVYLEGLFPTFNVDCEYNKMLDDEMAAKRVIHEEVKAIRNRQRRARNVPERDEDELVCPDICVHRRGMPDRKDNLLVIELKKQGNDTDVDLDHAKLKAFTDGKEKFTYQYGLFLVIGSYGNVVAAVLYIDGKGQDLDVRVFPRQQSPVQRRTLASTKPSKLQTTQPETKHYPKP